jgi:hypothetical protein
MNCVKKKQRANSISSRQPLDVLDVLFPSDMAYRAKAEISSALRAMG